MDFNIEFKKRTEHCDEVVNKFLPEVKGRQKTVIEAMDYSVTAGGKRLRPLLMHETYRMFGGKNEELIEPFMAAIEMIHTYSLVHDDLPAMDNDEYRRGRKTTHAVYGAGMATLAGDGLLNYAFETALKAAPYASETTEYDGAVSNRFIMALMILADKAGINGMVGGQCADIEAEGRKDIATEDVLFIHENKTAAMLESSMMIGAVLAGASKQDVQNIEKAGSNIGIAFQIRDDILDIVGDEKELGKSTGSDIKNEKVTYVSLNGMIQSVDDVKRLSEEAISLMAGAGEQDEFITDLIMMLTSRKA